MVGVVLGFARTLRAAGVTASPDRVEAMLSAVSVLGVLDATAVYWAGRLTLCAGPDDLDRYDAAFAAYFGGEAPRRSTSTSGPPPRVSSTAPLEQGSGAGDEGEDPADLAVAASGDEVLRHRDVADLTPAEREHLRRLFALVRPAAPMRASRR
ncbi:MAG TPA: hypothetical protein VJ352_12500, partial [Geodermatophilus sp.]|nr:hypothetical protein [Geodermatophilus sp.]